MDSSHCQKFGHNVKMCPLVAKTTKRLSKESKGDISKSVGKVHEEKAEKLVVLEEDNVVAPRYTKVDECSNKATGRLTQLGSNSAQTGTISVSTEAGPILVGNGSSGGVRLNLELGKNL